MAKSLLLARYHGVVLSDVEPDSPAGNAGLKRADVLFGFDDQAIVSASQLESHIFRREAGDKVNLTVRRGKEELNVILASRLRALCVQIDKDLASRLPGKRYSYGLAVAAKSPERQAQFLDLQPGDIS